MKFYFENDEKLKKGIEYVSEDLDIELVKKDNADIIVTILETEERKVFVSLSKNQANITYGGGKARFFRGLATLCGWIRTGETEKEKTETPLFETNGSMLDMSRNSVLKVSQVKTMMRKMALMGMNMYMLYTEDTYEIENRPWFGYLRGRYTKEEIKDMDAYALELGIELIPCIQTLGHLATHLRWDATVPYKDTDAVLLVGAEETYSLIDEMLKTVTECFTTKRVHVGMDEAFDLGIGRYLELNGYRKRLDILFEHIGRVCEQIEKYGLKPIMWSDMFFRIAGEKLENYTDYDVRVELDESIREKVPATMQQVFWDYYNSDQEFYEINIDKHLKYIDENTMFAGGVWLWGSHVPQYSRSFKNTIPALYACKKKGIREVLSTVWICAGEAHLMMSLAGLAWYADFDYVGEYDEESMKTCFYNSCGVDYDELFMCEEMDRIPNGEYGICRIGMYNDPLCGIYDKHFEKLDAAALYRSVSEKMKNTSEDKGIFEPAYKAIQAVCSLLENKADFGLRLRKAYNEKDVETLKKMATECDVIIEKLKVVKKVQKEAWMYYNKPFGWEVHDIRYGGLIARFETAKERIEDYISGKYDRIEELETERFDMGDTTWIRYTSIATANML